MCALLLRDDLGFAANFLYMSLGQLPDPAIVAAFETSLILYAEHSFNASTFTARAVASTRSDLNSAITAAIGALKGPLHGGANEAVMDMMDEIGSPGCAEQWLDAALGGEAKDHGLRSPRLQERRLTRPRHARRTWRHR